jgi:transposase
MTSATVYAGVDVSKADLDLAFSDSDETVRFPNSEHGIGELIEALEVEPPALVVLEATGGFETATALALAAREIPVVVVNPRQVRKYVSVMEMAHEVDAEFAGDDAQEIWVCKDEFRPYEDAGEATTSFNEMWGKEPISPPFHYHEWDHQVQLFRPDWATVYERRATKGDPTTVDDILLEHKPIASRIRQIIDMLTQEKNRLGFALPALHKGIKKHIRWLERQLADVDQDLDDLIRTSPIWQAKSDLLREVPGVGPNLTRTLLAELPELGTLSNKEIAALVGVAPFPRDSGLMRGKRMVWGGRAPVRSALYLSIWSASKWNPVIRVFYQRLRARGKPPKVAQVACMRKLLTILNAMLRDGRQWDPKIPLNQLQIQHSC